MTIDIKITRINLLTKIIYVLIILILKKKKKFVP